MRRGLAMASQGSSPSVPVMSGSLIVAEASDLSTHHVGVVGAGQLARMAAEAGSALGLSVAVLAESPDDAACAVASEVLLGSPLVEADLRALADRVDVVTFDHEQVDLAIVRALLDDGVVIRPGLQTLEMAVDKAHMRAVLDQAGMPVAGPHRAPGAAWADRSATPP